MHSEVPSSPLDGCIIIILSSNYAWTIYIATLARYCGYHPSLPRTPGGEERNKPENVLRCEGGRWRAQSEYGKLDKY